MENQLQLSNLLFAVPSNGSGLFPNEQLTQLGSGTASGDSIKVSFEHLLTQGEAALLSDATELSENAQLAGFAAIPNQVLPQDASIFLGEVSEPAQTSLLTVSTASSSSDISDPTSGKVRLTSEPLGTVEPEAGQHQHLTTGSEATQIEFPGYVQNQTPRQTNDVLENQKSERNNWNGKTILGASDTPTQPSAQPSETQDLVENVLAATPNNEAEILSYSAYDKNQNLANDLLTSFAADFSPYQVNTNAGESGALNSTSQADFSGQSVPAVAVAAQTAQIISRQINNMAGEPIQTITADLHPAELGQLKVRVEKSAEQMSAQIVASEVVSAELLLREKDFLLQALADLGIEDAEIDIRHRQPGDGFDDPEHREQENSRNGFVDQDSKQKQDYQPNRWELTNKSSNNVGVNLIA